MYIVIYCFEGEWLICDWFLILQDYIFVFSMQVFGIFGCGFVYYGIVYEGGVLINLVFLFYGKGNKIREREKE